MTRAPTYPIHRNRRNSISIRFSVRSIRFSRCGPGPVGPRPPASLALGGKEIHYPPWRARVKGDPPLHRDSTTGGGGARGGRPGTGEARPLRERAGPASACIYDRRGSGRLDGLAPAKKRKAPVPRGPRAKRRGRPKAAPVALGSALRERGSLSSRSLALQYFRRRRA